MRFLVYTFFFLFCTTALPAQSTFPVRFNWGTEYFPDNFEAIRLKSPDQDELVEGRYVRYLQFTEIPAAADRARLESTGMQFLGYVSFGAYLVSLPTGFDVSLLDPLHPRSMVPVKPEWKMSASLRQPPYGDWAIHGDQIDLNLQVYPHLSIEMGAALFRQNGMTVLKTGTQNGFISVRVHKNSLNAICALPFVQYLELTPPPGKPEDTKGRSLHRSNVIDSDQPAGLHYNGTGVRVLVRDDGVVGPHVDFQGRLNNLTDNTTGGDHGDWVSGVMAGAGNIDPTAKGMAAGAEIFVIDYVYDFQDQTLPLFADQDVTITNSSYTDGCNTAYSLAAQTVDRQMYQHPTLQHVFSAGNSGTTNCSYGAGPGWGNITGGHKMAKSAIAVANLRADASVDPTSSRGPASDGRLKPEISAMGTDVFMTQPDNTYSTASGTSFASPSVAGCLAQLSQAYKAQNNGNEPTTELLRAAIFNTANDLGNPGPDFVFGWGHINVLHAFRLLEGHHWITGQVEQGGSDVHTVHIPAGISQARLMIVWSDPPAAQNAAKALINDLDLSVTDPNGVTDLPWVLDPTPLINKLNAPAGKGRDSLNTTEQVSIDHPIEGNYLVAIKGTEVPMGPQGYTLVWTFIPDGVKMTYPAGGEGFVPGETERLRWDAFGVTDNFTLRYSTNNGNSWNTLTTVNADQRYYDWAVPPVISGAVRLLITRGGAQDTTQAFTIVPQPANLDIVKVCPDSITVSWLPVNDTLPYDVYLLGAQFMEVIGHTSGGAGTHTFPIQNAGLDRWVSVRPANAFGLAGRRNVAVNWPGGLKNCKQTYDLAVKQLIAPNAAGEIACSSIDKPVTVLVRNEGSDTVSASGIHFQLAGQSVTNGVLPLLAPGDSVVYTFPTLLHVQANGIFRLKVWTDFGLDGARFNDTLTVPIPFATQPATSYFTEDFEASAKLPFGWLVSNPDLNITWALIKGSSLIGSNGSPTRAIFLNYFSYPAQGQEDYLYMKPLDLSAIVSPSLTFDLAYAPYDNSNQYPDSLRVDVFPGCDLNTTPVTIWGKSGNALATDAPSSGSYYPSSQYSWHNISVSLQQFAGQSVVIRFAGANAYGNNVFLDNIGINNPATILPDGNFSFAPDSICRLDTVVFQALTAAPGQTNLKWSFGLQAQPSTGAGPGPIKVRYLTAGVKSISLIAVTPAGSDTVQHNLNVKNFPVANFIASVNYLTVAFDNTSQFAQFYLWDFGDGQTSTEQHPSHTYAAPGTYTVTLTSGNFCKSVTKTQTIMAVSAVHDLSGQVSIRLLPNPTEGDFTVEMQAPADPGTVRLQLLDASGRLVKSQETQLSQTVTVVPFKGLHLPGGVYELSVRTDKGMQSFKVVVE